MAAVVDREQHQGALTPEAILKLYKTLASKFSMYLTSQLAS